MQETLFKKSIKVKCRVTESGFDVENTEDFDIKTAILYHSPNKQTNEKIGVTKEEFEVEVKECYNADVEWLEPKIYPNEFVKGINTPTRAERFQKYEDDEAEDRAEMIKEVNEKGFNILSGKYEYWTHYGKKESNENQIEAVLKYQDKGNTPYGIIISDAGKYLNTWMITKDFGLYLIEKYKMIKQPDNAVEKWINPQFKKIERPNYKFPVIEVTKEELKNYVPETKEQMDKRIEETNKDKKGVIEIERRSNGEHGVFPKIEGEFFMGKSSKDSEGKEKQEVEETREFLIKNGIRPENISIHEHKYVYDDDKPENVEKAIKEHSEKLKIALQKKFGYPITIRILKAEEKK